MTNMDEGVTRARAVRRRLVREGPPWTREHEGDFETVTVPERHCDRLRDLIVREQAERVVEIGLAYASSALAIGEALAAVNRPFPRHVVIDPLQEREYANTGWQLMCSAGLDSIATLMAAPSSIALPQLLAEGFVADAAFVDGSHRFHEVFVDLYYLRKIVRPGGLVVVDDDWWPSVHAAVNYYELNLGWTAVPDAFPAESAGAGPRGGKAARCKAFRLPDPSFEPSFEDFRAF
ncbi:class I SAM-dependent methyltransferase [Streptomyces sp. NRRL F-5126]|uniref:class I SAM-dependent methyltransferase n=1 Tax=Streptomyces sp. NRRL F-5126 TaxID=1463857 RepID=UPI000B13A994|nr:class I SAM-dependent methyltransferase [Streptomyces sp. NRRL F-5126]